MPLRTYLTFMGIGTLISGASWAMVLVFLDPEFGSLGLVLFFGSFFLFVFGFGSLAGFVVRWFFRRHQPAFRHVAVSFRQAALVAMLLTISLLLQSQRLFTWWSALVLLVFLSLVEAFFAARMRGGGVNRGGARGA